MHWGLTKRQWFLLCSLLLFPLTLNIVAMWYEVRREFLVEAICTGIWTYATNISVNLSQLPFQFDYFGNFGSRSKLNSWIERFAF
jgi:hypothetical protein